MSGTYSRIYHVVAEVQRRAVYVCDIAGAAELTMARVHVYDTCEGFNAIDGRADKGCAKKKCLVYANACGNFQPIASPRRRFDMGSVVDAKGFF